MTVTHRYAKARAGLVRQLKNVNRRKRVISRGQAEINIHMPDIMAAAKARIVFLSNAGGRFCRRTWLYRVNISKYYAQMYGDNKNVNRGCNGKQP